MPETGLLIQMLIMLIAIGAFAGVLAGLLGVGGGIVLVPAFFYAFQTLGYDGPQLMQVCLATSLATALFTRAFGESGVAMATLVMTLLVLIFAEVLPKTYAITNAEKAAGLASRPISVVVTLFAPVVGAVRLLVRGVLRVFGVATDPDTNVLAVRDEIAGAIQLGHSEGVVEKEDRDRILGALDLGERAVEEIMLHRSDIEMIDAGLPVMDILSHVLDSQHTRLPLFRDEPENIVGVLHAKDLLRAMHRMLGDGRIDPEVARTYPLTEIHAAQADFVEGDHVGKLVLLPGR